MGRRCTRVPWPHGRLSEPEGHTQADAALRLFLYPGGLGHALPTLLGEVVVSNEGGLNGARDERMKGAAERLRELEASGVDL